MEAYDDDDDTHFCIKCHLTVNGLENYVRHRQSGCRPPEAKQSEVTNETPSTPTTVTYPEILNADAFFSSLELQSSTKSNPALRSRSLVDRERKAGRTEDKGKKKARRGQEPDDGTLKEKLLSMPPVVADLDDLMDHLGIPSLVGFPDIVTTTGGKTSTVTSGKSTCTPSSTKMSNHENLSASPVESIIASSKGCGERKRNEDPQRIEQDHGAWLDDTILVDLDTNSENKEGDHGELTSYTDYDYQQDEESDEESPEDDLDENDSYSNDDETEDREYPPRGHTGGKWKPSELLHDMSRLNEDEFIEDEDNQERPPPSHTGGKWKPADSSQGQRVEENELAGKDPGASSLGPSATTGRQPPPGHTRGKWIPGAPGDFGSGYWCDPCGRKLASRLLYNRHLLSDLHARRSIQEIDGDLQLPRGSGPLLQRKPASKRQRALAEIKSRSKTLSQEDAKETKKNTRRRQKEVLLCEMCQARVRRPQMGKHLLSHYHCRVAGTNPCSDPAARRFILENMSNVIRQCPFQCAICRFYCNTEATFLRHWRSILHTKKFDDAGGSYKCAPCDFYCKDNETMEQHLVSSSHREVVAMMNGSVPVVVGRQRFLVCETCNQRFRYNLQLRFHARETGHRGNATASDEYQSRISCGLCSQVVRSLVALQRHQLACHGREKDVKDDDAKLVVQPAAPYFCSFCVLNFTTAREAVLHRRTSSHKETVKAQKFTAENLASLARECSHCGSRQGSLLEHKEHLLQQHPELCHRCPRCGLQFALPQDVTRHTRDVKCTRPTEEYLDRATTHNGEWRCNNCSFVTDSQAEFLFHDALHAGSHEASADQAGCSKTPTKYRCPMCEKLFCKVTLRNHIRSHTGERPFRCVKCSTSFARRSSLNTHRKECASSASSFSTWPIEAEGTSSRRRSHACSECNAAFYNNHIASRLVSYRETYMKRRWGFFKKVATRINYRWQNFIEWNNVEECCTGYRRRGGTPLTCVPICPSGCIHGECRQPNACACNSGYRATLIDGQSSCVPDCNGNDYDPEGCGGHGQCIAPNKCECHTGYTLDVKKLDRVEEPKYTLPCVPKCTPECGITAYCHAPDSCECYTGYITAFLNPQTSTMECVPVCDKICINGECLSPNRCGCLPGYKQHPTDPFLCEPVCNSACFNANCTKPNHCECHRGYKKNPMDPPQLCSPICDPMCINADCTQPNHCECHDGYKKNVNGSSEICLPICEPPCINAMCIGPDNCECVDGYGKNPELPSQVCSPVCDPPCINSDCTQPNHCECHHGYKTNPKGPMEFCLPICDPPCVNAACNRPNICECQYGYGKNPQGPSEVCLPVCDSPCINADCTEPNHCECHRGYKKDPNVSSQVCLPVCEPACINAACTQPYHCECHDGYKKNVNESSEICLPICEPPCINAKCIGPGNCECVDGYGKNPELPSQVCSPVCDPPCINSDCTHPNHCECHHGYKTTSTDPIQVCLPVCDPPCINAFCYEPDTCKCHDGYEAKPAKSNSKESCWPVCDPPCSANASCEFPNTCTCNVGYVAVSTETSSSVINQPLTSSDINSRFKNGITCQPLCEPVCNKNASCIAPNQCQCDRGYRLASPSDQPITPTQCLPICEKDCVNAFCGHPNKCICFKGYKPSPVDDFVCEPFCQHDCINANCIGPDHCECHDGYEKTEFIPAEAHENLTITDNLCIPSCPEECLNASCIAPNQCLCNPGYVLADSSTNSSQRICQPLCEPNCSSGMECVAPNQCQSESRYSQKINEFTTNLPDVSSITENCSNISNPVNENGTRICKNGWTGWKCDEPSFCVIIFVADNETNEQLSTVLRHALKQHILRHAGKSYKCGLPGCPTVLRTENELRSHRLVVHETASSDRHFQCNECPYAAKTRTQLRRHRRRHEAATNEENSKQLSCPYSHCNFATKVTSHLRRHVRLHTGTKPYKCRHCTYASNNLENLRKHVLSTSLHPGKTIYECDVCHASDSLDPYCTNFAKELRAHLLEAHPRDFPRPSDASDHVAKIFSTDGETTASPTPDDANNPYEDSITGQITDHEYKC